MESMKAELVEVSQSWESREKGLRDELEQSNKRLEDQLADSQEQLLTLTQEASELRTELDKVRKHCANCSFGGVWLAAVCGTDCLVAAGGTGQGVIRPPALL